MTTFDENKYKTFRELFNDINQIKMEVRLLYGKELQSYKEHFYKQQLAEFGLSCCWKYIWDDMDYKQLKRTLQM